MILGPLAQATVDEIRERLSRIPSSPYRGIVPPPPPKWFKVEPKCPYCGIRKSTSRSDCKGCGAPYGD